MYEDKTEKCTLLLKKITFDFKKELNKEEEKRKGKIAKRSFGLIFNRVRNNKDNIKKKTLSLRKRGKAIVIHQRYIIYERPACKNLKACYYTVLKIALKGGASSACT